MGFLNGPSCCNITESLLLGIPSKPNNLTLTEFAEGFLACLAVKIKNISASTQTIQNMVSTLPKPITLPRITTQVVDYTTYEDLIHSIRTEVFVHEQSIPAELEIDQDDWVSKHVLAYYDGRPVGTGRLTPAGRIGRVAVSRPIRRRGVGFCIMKTLLEVARQNNHPEVVLAAQHHAVKFYEKLGFFPEGNIFMEVGIAHVMMRKKLSGKALFES